MSEATSYGEVAALVAKALDAERATRARHIEDVARDLRAEFRREVIELREEVGELVAELHKAIERESVLRDEGDAFTFRYARERAEHVS